MIPPFSQRTFPKNLLCAKRCRYMEGDSITNLRKFSAMFGKEANKHIIHIHTISFVEKDIVVNIVNTDQIVYGNMHIPLHQNIP
jgi:hypothetical protein